MLDAREFRAAMAKLPSGVCVITTNGPAGRGGFTASAVCSVTDSPPTVLVCMNRLSAQRETFANNGVLCVNVLAGDQGDVSLAFSQSAREGTAKRFETGLWTEVNHGLPALRGALVSLACRVTNTVEVGSHNVLFSEVDAVIDSPVESGLVYFKRAYCHPAPIG